MKEALQAAMRKKYAYYYQSEFQNRLTEQTQNIGDLIASVSENNDGLRAQVEETYADIKKLNDEKDPNGPIVPGLKIERLIRQMAEQDSYEPAEIKLWHNEVWKSLEEINAEIKRQERGYILYYKLLERKCADKISLV